MKKTFFIAITLLSTLCLFSQGSSEYSMAVYKKVSSINSYFESKYKDTFVLRRVETGVLDQYTDGLYGSTERILYAEKKYLMAAFTDSRMKDFKLVISQKNDNGNWQVYKTVNDNKATDTKDLIGDLEVAYVTPAKTASYKIEIMSSGQTSGTSRYGIMLLSEEISSQPQTNNNNNNTNNNTGSGTGTTNKLSTNQVTYSIDNYSVASYNTSADKYGDFGTESTYSCLFIINAGETIVTRKESSGSVTVYYIENKDDTDERWLDYTIRASDGKKYGFMLPKNGNKYIRVIKRDGVSHNPLTDYHIANQWTD